MAAVVKLKDIVDALEVQIDEAFYFLDRETGEVHFIQRDLLRRAEEAEPDEGPDYDWEKGAWDVAMRIVEGGDFVKLPSKWEVHEWEIMSDFSESVESKRIREELLDAIHGRGAFRCFRDTIRRHRIEQSYAWREEALREIAIEWCKEHGIEWKGFRESPNSGSAADPSML